MNNHIASLNNGGANRNKRVIIYSLTNGLNDVLKEQKILFLTTVLKNVVSPSLSPYDVPKSLRNRFTCSKIFPDRLTKKIH